MRCSEMKTVLFADLIYLQFNSAHFIFLQYVLTNWEIRVSGVSMLYIYHIIITSSFID